MGSVTARKIVVAGFALLFSCLVSGSLTRATAADGQVAITVRTSTGTPDTGGSVARSPAGTLVGGTTYNWPNNTNVTFTISPSAGYVIYDVIWNNVSAGAVGSLVKNIKNNDSFTLEAVFKQVVTASASYSSTPAGAPSGSLSPTGPFDLSTVQNFTVTSPDNWLVNTVRLDNAATGTLMTLACTPSGTHNSCTFSQNVGTSNHTFYVAMVPYDYPANAGAPTAAVTTSTIAVTNNITDADGVQNITYYVYSDAAGSTLVSSNGSGSFTGLADSTDYWVKTTAQTKNKTTDSWVNQESSLVKVTTSAPNYNLALSIALGSGSVTVNGAAVTPPATTTVGKNQSVTYAFTAAADYILNDVKVNGVSQGPQSPFTISNVTADKTVAVYFKRVWTISVNPGANGSISPADPAKVVDGGSQTFTITPATGADILQVLVDGADQGPVSSYTFSNVTADHTIAATFLVSTSDMDKYSVIPPFIASAIKPNLLLMLDNSASMYDLAYFDQTIDPATSRLKYYCYDPSYSDASAYEGYFDQAAIYSYNSADNKFVSGATLPEAACTFKTGYLCVNMVDDGSGGKTTSQFIASGKFLNWLTASKFDVQKKVLTGGRFNTTYNVLEGESRGCVGRRYIKEPKSGGAVLTDADGYKLSFAVRGPASFDADFVNQSTQGGGTRIEIYRSADGYNSSSCKEAADVWVAGGNLGTFQTAATACLGSGSSALKSAAYNNIVHLCYRGVNDENYSSNLNALHGKCEDIYKDATIGYNNNPALITNENAADAVCASTLPHPDYGNGGGNTLGYLGRCFLYDPAASGANQWKWDADAGVAATCSDTEIRDYCAGTTAFDVIDPSNTATSGAGTPIAAPSFLMDAGANALGKVTGTFLARVALSAQPTGIIQEYKDYISFGAMRFNQDGSGSECNDGVNNTTSPIKCPKNCSVTTSKQCYISSDCPAGESCVLGAKTNGGKVIAYANYDPVGDHSTGLIQQIDTISGTSWTPWAEAYYNAIGYFANRTDLRLQEGDFDVIKNPSDVSCRLNNILIISDGGSTADQHSSVSALAGVYNDGDGQTGNCSGFAGSKNLDDLAWLANNRNIKTFVKGTASTDKWTNNNEFIRTYSVFTGKEDATQAGECNPKTLMSQTAVRGGTSPYVADGGAAFRDAMDDAFKKIAASSASGTAASILSNSEGSGAALMQAVFYPKKNFDKDSAGNDTSANWLGELQGFWYFLDPFLSKSSIREDTDVNYKLHLINDKILQFQFDTVDKETRVYRFLDTDGDGSADAPDALDANGNQVSYDPDEVKSIWRAGRKLWLRDASSSSASRRTIYTTLNGSALVKLSTNATDGALHNNATARTYLRAADAAAAEKLINYVNGKDQTDFRTRKVAIKSCSNNRLLNCTADTAASVCGSGNTCGSHLSEWKLGDIISSTPKMASTNRLNNYNMSPPNGYSDGSYKTYTESSSYTTRGMAFVGANDGMLHAFRMGILKETPERIEKAKLTYPDNATLATSSSDLGKEEWAFTPRHALPYLKYLADNNYTHVYYVDRSPTIADASIGTPDGCVSDYSECTKSADTWRTVLIGGMGIGGAVRNIDDEACANCIKTPVDGVGYSSYFALDVTTPTSPTLLWEFAGNPDTPNLGLSTTGPAIVRISAKKVDEGGNPTQTPDHSKNGKWVAVFASGATGRINTADHSLSGISDQNLRLFIVDLASGTLIKEIDTGITNAFAGTLTTSVIDTDRNSPSSNGFYGDDAVYIGYVQKDADTNTWTKGGVIRLLTREGDPANSAEEKKWKWSKVIDGIGPVTTSITKLQDRTNKKLWLYFGSGRYFYRTDDTSSTRQSLFGIKEPCYSTAAGPTNDIDHNCTADPISSADLLNQSGESQAVLNDPTANSITSKPGWRIDLDADASGFMTERVITDPIAMPNGAVFFTTFKPSTDICKYGGSSLIWAVRYNTGGAPPTKAMQGQALMQVSTGAFAEIKLSTAFSNPGSQRLDGRRLATPITGVPPAAQGLSLFTNPPPAKKFLHVREK